MSERRFRFLYFTMSLVNARISVSGTGLPNMSQQGRTTFKDRIVEKPHEFTGKAMSSCQDHQQVRNLTPSHYIASFVPTHGQLRAADGLSVPSWRLRLA